MTTTKTDRDDVVLPLQIPTLRLVFSGSEGISAARRYVLSQGPTPIGRDVSANDGIGLHEDEHATRVHANFHVARTEAASEPIVHLTDAPSKNGTFVNGRCVSQCRLQDGDVIRVGSSFLVFRIERSEISKSSAGPLLGTSPAIRALRFELDRVAASADEVLLCGESGTGKELAAKHLHALRRAQGREGPLISVNCAELVDSLSAAQLFGHVQGAFTDAKTPSEGFFRAAQRGTLFLDEIGDMQLPLQAQLLRVIEQKEVLAVGATRAIPIDVRVVAATHRNLRQSVEQGRFRGDLYMRLASLPIALPPLRARREDILLLLTHLGPLPQLPPSLVHALLLYNWPYNVRELAKITADLVSHARLGRPLHLQMIAHRIGTSAADEEALEPSKAAVELGAKQELSAVPESDGFALAPPSETPTREYVVELLRKHNGVLTRAGVAANRDARTVARWAETHGLDLAEFRRERKKGSR